MERRGWVIITILVIALLISFGAFLVYQQSAGSNKQNAESAAKTKMEASPAPRVATVEPTKTTENESANSLSLSIKEPQDGATVAVNSVVVKGTTVKNAEVTINNQDIVADSKGNFSATVALDEGDNPILIVAGDENGNYAEKEINVTYL